MPALSRISLVLLLLLAALVLAGSPAHAQRQPERGERVAETRGSGQAQQSPQARQVSARARQERRQDSMADSIRHVRRANRGQIIAADRMHSNGRQINRIKMVDDRGRVRVIEDDPQRRNTQRSRGDDE